MRLFEGVVTLCISTGVVGGEAFSIDASLIKADVDKMKRLPGDQPISWPKAEGASHAVREYIAALDAASDDQIGDGGNGDGSSQSGHRRKEVSLTDPQATWVTRPGVDPFFAYDANYLIDNKAGIIVDAVGTAVVEIETADLRFAIETRLLGADAFAESVGGGLERAVLCCCRGCDDECGDDDGDVRRFHEASLGTRPAVP